MQHILGIDGLSDADITAILDCAQAYADGLRQPELLRGRIVFSLFFENSTRTRVSFETAAKRLGAEVVNWSPGASSVAKGESFADTIATLAAMRPDAIIMRHTENRAPHMVAERALCPVINGGDGTRAHPTQALLDALTLRQARGQVQGLTLVYCGDIAHSRVAGSGMEIFRRLGARIRIVAPPAFMPMDLPPGVEAFTRMEDGMPGADVVIPIRPQNERMDTALIDDAGYAAAWGLTPQRLALAAPGALVMAPGPIRRGVEIDGAVADDPARSLILKQVANGVFVRMAVLDLLLAER
ncbi:MAG TPA: aspartate carbamoyltransferase catalytic subunit [Rhodospirillaceae bacterium]|jgi:aspartate carbamoyltransferase catalytic subunit|nr:aspartate carbamoyltransferase catalytic subunit [Alphaproteobacteria bacterium]HBH26239.1 aspartate carbamoyltransferase catalytic subunit [Rhodospirillaceae bacterium]